MNGPGDAVVERGVGEAVVEVARVEAGQVEAGQVEAGAGGVQMNMGMSGRRLTWSLALATYRRPEMLLHCVTLALQQSRPPDELVVVDGSPDWEASRVSIAERCAAAGVPLRYEAAVVRSSSAQRNQAADLCRSDVVFLIDDDALMTPRCAELVMSVYEADLNGEIVAVGAADATESEVRDVLPGTLSTHARQVDVRRTVPPAVAAFRERLLLMGLKWQWVPYDGQFPKHELSARVAALPIEQVNLMSGYQMTFRRSVLQRERFDGHVANYATFEYQDLLNRVHRHGAVVCALDAHLHHAEAQAGRSRRRVVTASQSINQAWFVRLHSSDLERDRRRALAVARRRILADLIKDCGRHRFALPQARGAWFGYRQAVSILDPSRDLTVVREALIETQRQLVKLDG